MIMDFIYFGTLAFGFFQSYTKSVPEKINPMNPPVIASPSTSTSHITTSAGEGTNHVYNVSIINNNSNQIPTHPNTYESTQDYFKKKWEQIRLSDISSTIYEYSTQNKYYIAVTAALSCYLYVFYKLRTIQSYIDNQSTWSAWKKDISLENLLAIPQEALTNDLMLSIQERHISIENPTDSLAPLVAFSLEIKREKELLTAYHHYVSWCTRCSINTILPFSQKLLPELTERKQRITYLSTLFQSWLAHYKLQKISEYRGMSK